MTKVDTQEDFLRKVSPVCAGRIGLDKFEYTRSAAYSTATCLSNPTHQDFSINANKLMTGVGCPECAGNKPKTLRGVFEEIKKVHGDKFSLTENSIYVNTNTKMELFCNKCQVPFLVSPKKCKAGQGHRACARDQASIARACSFEEFVKRSDEIFGPNVFVHSKESYVNLNTETVVGCRVHGDFRTTPVNFLNQTYGCSACWRLARGRSSYFKFSEKFEERATTAHKGKYDYSKFVFINGYTKGLVGCPRPKHGYFYVTPSEHICSLSGCPSCSHTFSQAQEELTEYVRRLGLVVETNVKLASGLEIDILIRSLGIAIEYNGLRWHSDQFRPVGFYLRKTLECETQGLRLVHIFEDEWLLKREITEELLSVILGKCNKKLDARKCEVGSVSWFDYQIFNNLHHLQGSGPPPTIRIGLWSSKVLVAVMGFSSRESLEQEIELVRFSSDGIVRGAFSKLLHHAKKMMPESITKIVSFSDLRWSKGAVYHVNGFRKVSRTRPSYWYVLRDAREDKRAYQRQYLPTKLKVYDPELSEVENCRANGLYRIFDCGKDKWELSI